jgi:hypothetical protein
MIEQLRSSLASTLSTANPMNIRLPRQENFGAPNPAGSSPQIKCVSVIFFYYILRTVNYLAEDNYFEWDERKIVPVESLEINQEGYLAFIRRR